MIVCGVDFETTGLDPEKDSIIEVGAVLFDWDKKLPLQIHSQLMDRSDEQRDWTMVAKLTGITPEILKKHGVTGVQPMMMLEEMINRSDAIMAHNAQFDMAFRHQWLRQNGMQNKLSIPVLDSMADVPYTCEERSRRLGHLAAAHGFLNPFPHRALFDVMTMLKVASHYSLDEIIARSKSPTIRIRALVSYDDRQKAKDAGFQWDGPMRVWVKDIKEIDLGQEYPFQTIRIK